MNSSFRMAAAVAFLAPLAFAQVPLPPHASTYNGFTRGYNFTSTTNFIITQLDLPPEAFQAGDTASYMVRVNAVEVLRSVGNAGPITTSILVNPGDVVDVLGNWSPAATTNFTAHNSYGNTPFSTTILGVSHALTRTGWQWDISDPSYLSGSYLTPTTGQLGRVLMYVSPQDGLFSNFTATPTTGASPLNVQFTDTTFTSDPNGVQSWAWDLDGDSVIDSNAQNPSFTYTVCGAYDVTLTTTDTIHPPSTVTKVGFIFADPQFVVDANFSASTTSGPTPLNVSFTDTSTGLPTSWAWDFNGDSIVDSTLQNPSFNYVAPGFYTVSLTASNSCFGDSETKTNFINVVGATVNTQSAEVLEYQFNEVRGTNVANVASTTLAPPFGTIAQTGWQTDPGRPLFRANEPGFGALAIDSTTPYDNYVQTGWPLNLQGSHTIMFWMNYGGVTGTAYPFGVASTPTSARCWKSGTTLQLLGWGQVPTTTTLAQPSSLVGWQHYCIVVDDQNGTAQWYVNGIANGNQTSFTAGTFSLVGGQFLVGSYSSSRTNNITRFFDMDDFRLYSRALTASEIQTEAAAENPTAADMEAGCTDSNNFSPRLESNGAPQIGNLAFGLTASGLEPNRPTAIYVGLSAYLSGFLPLDLSGTGIFNTGCNLLVSPDIILNFSSGAGTVFLPSPIPLDPTLQGGHAYTQVINLGSGALSAVSNAIDLQMQF